LTQVNLMQIGRKKCSSTWWNRRPMSRHRSGVQDGRPCGSMDCAWLHVQWTLL